MKQKRANHHKIPDIKAVRSLTRLLGKLHIPSCYYTYPELVPVFDKDGFQTGTMHIDKESYGFGLKEAKDFVEAWFDYEVPQQEPKQHAGVAAPYMPYPRY